jgi:hypothetical protein
MEQILEAVQFYNDCNHRQPESKANIINTATYNHPYTGNLLLNDKKSLEGLIFELATSGELGVVVQQAITNVHTTPARLQKLIFGNDESTNVAVLQLRQYLQYRCEFFHQVNCGFLSFHTAQYDQGRKTCNSFVKIKRSDNGAWFGRVKHFLRVSFDNCPNPVPPRYLMCLQWYSEPQPQLAFEGLLGCTLLSPADKDNKSYSVQPIDALDLSEVELFQPDNTRPLHIVVGCQGIE